MGEEDLKYYYSRADTHVFWNLEDYPIPADFDSIYPNITSALHRMGFHTSWVGIITYGDEPKHDQKELEKAEIYYKPDQDEDSIVNEMTVDIINWAAVNHRDPVNIVVIAKQDPESEFHRVLKCLKSRNHSVLLVEPPHDDTTAQASLFQSVDSVVNATRDLGGGKPRSGKPHEPGTQPHPADTVSDDEDPNCRCVD